MNAISGTAAARSRRTDGDGDGGGVLVDRRWLAAHLGDPHVRVVEVDVGPAAHTEWHIDGAVLWNVYGDLKDADYRTVTEAELERLVGRSGIDAESIVVCYGYAPALGFWLLKLLGHRDVRILDCSRDAWRADGLPWTTADGRPAAATAAAAKVLESGRTWQRSGTPSGDRVRRWWTCAQRPSSTASGSGRRAAWSRARRPVTSLPPFTVRWATCTTMTDRSDRPCGCATRSHPTSSTGTTS